MYIALARLVNAVVANPPDSLVIISVTCSGLSAVALYHLGRVLFGRLVGVLAALTLAQPFSLAVWLALVLAVNSAIFLFAPQYVAPGNRFKLLSRDTINAADAYYAGALDTIRGRFPSTKTVLVGANWRQIAYYLPDYPLIKSPLQNGPEEANSGNPVVESELILNGLSTGPSSLTVVFFDRGLRYVTTSVGQAEAILLASGDTIWHVNVDGASRLRWTASHAAWGTPP